MGAHKTAIRRKAMSAPAKLLQSKGLIKGRVLDYGCGHGYDATALGADGYDPFWKPTEPQGLYDTILCTYVLNVIEDVEERRRVLDRIKNLLAPNGNAYVSVRNDTGELNGVTTLGSWQGLVTLDLPVVVKNPRFVTYRI